MEGCRFLTCSDLVQVYIHRNSVIIRIVLLLISSLKRSGCVSIFSHHKRIFISHLLSLSKITLLKSYLVVVSLHHPYDEKSSPFSHLSMGPLSYLSYHFSDLSRDPSNETSSSLLYFFFFYLPSLPIYL